ncbi:MAG: molybdopterin-dependent oxidoreductase [Eggerthellaceae bacterium]|nr:molybdopterin-dependent oxidoreductase [Eggerthellaceae bacterium]
MGKEEAKADPVEQTFISGYRFPGCFMCQAKVTVRDGKVVKAETNPDDPRGKRPCLRGRAQLQRLYNADRIKYPLRRVGERGEGKFERITWDEAMDEIFTKWNAYIAQYGKSSVCFTGATGGAGYLNGTSGVNLYTRVLNEVGIPQFGGCSDYATPTGINKVFGPATNVYGWPSFEPANVRFSKTYFCWGGNKPLAAIQDWNLVLDAQKNGTKVIIVDPTYTAETMRADLWVRPRPATDTALILSMIQVIVENGWQDTAFLEKHTVAPLLVRSDTGKFLREDDLAALTAETADAAAATEVGDSAAPAQAAGTGTNAYLAFDEAVGAFVPVDAAQQVCMSGTYPVGNITVTTAFDLFMAEANKWTPAVAEKVTDVPAETIVEIARIAALEGPIDHATGYGNQAYDNGVEFGHALAALIAFTGNIGKVGAGFGANALSMPFNYQFMMPGYKSAPSYPILGLFEILKTGMVNGTPITVKSLFCAGVGLTNANCDQNRIVNEIVNKIEFLVVADVAYTDTVMQADIVLPAGHPYESEDLFGGLVSDPFAFYDDKCVEPLYECKPDGDIARLLAKGFGVPDLIGTNDEMLAMVFDSPYLEAMGVTVERVKKEHAVRYYPLGYVDNAACIYPTDTTRLEVYCETPRIRANFGQTFDAEREHLPHFRLPKEAWNETVGEYAKLPITEKYPLILMSERPRNRFHSHGVFDPWMLELEPEPTMKMNPVDAKARGIEDDSLVEIYNDRGHAVARVWYDDALRPGTLIYPKGHMRSQFKAGGWSELTSSDFDPMAVNNSFFDTAVEVRAWKE